MGQSIDNSPYLDGKKWLTGILLIAIGGAFLLEQTALFDLQNLSAIWQYWPIVFALFGVLKILTAQDFADVVSGCSQIVITVWIYSCLSHSWGCSFTTTWPLLLIIGGLNMILRAIFKKTH